MNSERPIFRPADPMNPGAEFDAQLNHTIAKLEKRTGEADVTRARQVADATEFARRVVSDSSQPIEVNTCYSTAVPVHMAMPSPCSPPPSTRWATALAATDTLALNLPAPSAAPVNGAIAMPGATPGNFACSHFDFLASTQRYINLPVHGAFDGGGWASRDRYQLDRARYAREYRAKKREWVRAISYGVMVQRSDMLLAATVASAVKSRASR